MFLLWLRRLSWCGDWTMLQFPHSPRAGLDLITLLFFPLAPWSYWVLCGSIYSFPVVRYPCLLSAGVLQALLCLKVYSWCIRGERCTPRPASPLPSCSLPVAVFNWNFYVYFCGSKFHIQEFSFISGILKMEPYRSRRSQEPQPELEEQLSKGNRREYIHRRTWFCSKPRHALGLLHNP